MSLRVELRARQSDNRGIYYAETKRAVIYLAMHETIEDVYKTYHHCFAEAGEADEMDEDQEERLIFCLQWAEIAL